MPSIEKQLKTLKAAYASGVNRVRFGDQEITYKTEEEMRRIIERLERQLNGAHKIKFVTPRFSKGLD